MWTANLFLYRDMSVYLQEPHSKRRAGQSFSNCGLKITYIVWEWTSSLSGSVNRQINREWHLFWLSNMQQKEGWKRIEMIIKMVNEFKLTVLHSILHAQTHPRTQRLCSPWTVVGKQHLVKPACAVRDGDSRYEIGPNLMEICACVWIYCCTKKSWKIRTGSLGCWEAGLLGLRAAGHRGPWATGHWATGLLLAKPKLKVLQCPL